MKKNYTNDDFLLRISSITKIKGSHKDYNKHSGDNWTNYRNDESCPRKSSTRRDKSRRNEFSRDEALVNSLDGSNARQEVRKLGAATASKIKQKSASPESPASCLKSTCSKKKEGVKKRVFFTETSCSPTSEDWGDQPTPGQSGPDLGTDYDYDWYPSQSSSQGGRRRPRSRAVSSSVSTSTVYAETSTSVSAESSVADSTATATSHELDRKLAKLKRDTHPPRGDDREIEPFRRTIVHQTDWRGDERNLKSAEYCQSAANEAPWPPAEAAQLEEVAMARPKSHSSRSSRRFWSSASARCTRGSPRANEAPESLEEGRLLQDLDRMELTSSTCCSGPTLPRIVKSRDVLKRVAIRRMLAYPPQGQSGEPLTLLKKWSNIDCHVQGDSQKGFKYKVYYLQEFESGPWYPDERTGGPFTIDDEVCSTDFG